MNAIPPDNESARLKSLHSYAILDSFPEQSYDEITRIASFISGTPIALISLIDEERQWFKSHFGIEAQSTPREMAFCAHAILHPEQILEVPDATLDPRFADNALVTGEPHIRYYCGAPLVTEENLALGTLCVIDRVPRSLDPERRELLRGLSHQVMAQLELRRIARDQRNYMQQLEKTHAELQLANARLRHLSLTDSLTGVNNRAAFDERLEQEFTRFRELGIGFSLLMIDVDRFKSLNDRFGHQAGDTTLRAIAATLSHVRPQDFLARFGGEEFAVILPDTDSDTAYTEAERLRRLIERGLFPYQPMTASMGLCTMDAAIPDIFSLIAKADAALYQAKEAGRNCVVVTA